MRFLQNLTYLLFAFFFCTQLNAQTSFHHGLGAGYSLSSTTYVDSYGSYESIVGAPGVVYSPRLAFATGSNSSVSVNTDILLGMNMTSSGLGTTGYFVAEVPLYAAYNFGMQSTAETESTFGGYFGLGYAANIVGTDYETIYNHGPMVSAGLRFIVRGKSMGLNLSYIHPMEESVDYTFSGRLLYYFK